MVGGKDSNLRRRTPTDLQSVPFGHSGTPPKQSDDAPGRECEPNARLFFQEFRCCFPYRGAGDGNRTRSLLITNQLLYR